MRTWPKITITVLNSSYSRGLLILCLAYVAAFGWLLLTSDRLPYVFDNNESFSSLWHARNLFDYGWRNSMGLADEAFSPHLAAHPYLHTHQGNFPRLFAFLIYLIGARSVESQIWVTTFTVGLAAIVMAYHFFAKVMGALFAAMFGLILISDYILVGQWQVGTYRVWHMFFIFSSVFLVDGARRVVGLMLLNCLSYCAFKVANSRGPYVFQAKY